MIGISDTTKFKLLHDQLGSCLSRRKMGAFTKTTEEKDGTLSLMVTGDKIMNLSIGKTPCSGIKRT